MLKQTHKIQFTGSIFPHLKHGYFQPKIQSQSASLVKREKQKRDILRIQE